jgi:hypothetical protein
MGMIFSILKISVSALLIIFVIYWFELDDMFLKKFEPTFRKMVDRIKRSAN